MTEDKSTVVEWNKLIAEFVGAEWVEDDYGNWGYKSKDFPAYFKSYVPAALLYHSSWDWLMPVVEKIENSLQWKYEVQIGNNLYVSNKIIYTCIIHDAGNATYLELESESKIEAAWFAVVDFIKFYKPQSKA